MAQKPLNGKHMAFCREYLVDRNATQAAIRAGYSRRTAGSQAHDLLKKPEIQEELSRLTTEQMARLDVQSDDVLRRIKAIAFADARTLTKRQAFCCRYCYGLGHLFQWKTEREYSEAYDSARAALGKEPDEWRLNTLPKNDGGYGYRATNSPNPDCPECAGVGILDVDFAATDTLSDEALTLFRGVKVTRNGIEYMMADQDKALELLAKHFGLVKEREAGPVEDALAELIRNAQGSALPIASAERRKEGGE